MESLVRSQGSKASKQKIRGNQKCLRVEMLWKKRLVHSKQIQLGNYLSLRILRVWRKGNWHYRKKVIVVKEKEMAIKEMETEM